MTGVQTCALPISMGLFHVEISSKKVVTIKNYMPNITVQYGRNKLIGIYSQPRVDGRKTVYLIEASSVGDLDRRISEKVDDIRKSIDVALDNFMKRFKVRIRFEKPFWMRYEDWIKGEEFVDSLPADLIIHDTVFKKVYSEGVEFVNRDEIGRASCRERV